MTFNLRAPNPVQDIILEAAPQNFNYSEVYYLYIPKPKHTFVITESIRTLTILAISSAPANLYTDFFKDWKIADKEPLTFYKSKAKWVIFQADWTIRVHSSSKPEEVFEVSKPDTFKRLKSYFQ